MMLEVIFGSLPPARDHRFSRPAIAADSLSMQTVSGTRARALKGVDVQLGRTPEARGVQLRKSKSLDSALQGR
jgi:hypothetical protein